MCNRGHDTVKESPKVYTGCKGFLVLMMAVIQCPPHTGLSGVKGAGDRLGTGSRMQEQAGPLKPGSRLQTGMLLRKSSHSLGSGFLELVHSEREGEPENRSNPGKEQLGQRGEAQNC